jgi:hypothetical protein
MPLGYRPGYDAESHCRIRCKSTKFRRKVGGHPSFNPEHWSARGLAGSRFLRVATEPIISRQGSRPF